jgi:phosphohistidine phosphatase
MGTLRLTLLRHGHAEAQMEGVDDFMRELTKRGRTDATAMGERLARAHLVPELVLASSAQRTQATVKLLAAACSIPKERIQFLDELYNASAHHIWDIAIAHAGDRAHVLVCAHNPGISRLASHVAAGTPTLARHLDLPPAGLVTALWHAGSWRSLQAADATGAQLLVP